MLVSLWSAAPAGAIVEEVSGTEVGLQPRVFAEIEDGPFGNSGYNPFPETFENANGNPVVHGSDVYLVYWDPTYHYHNDWKELIDKFAENVNEAQNSTADVFAMDEQYTDKTNVPAYNRVTFRGSYTDTTPYPEPAGCEDPQSADGIQILPHRADHLSQRRPDQDAVEVVHRTAQTADGHEHHLLHPHPSRRGSVPRRRW